MYETVTLYMWRCLLFLGAVSDRAAHPGRGARNLYTICNLCSFIQLCTANDYREEICRIIYFYTEKLLVRWEIRNWKAPLLSVSGSSDRTSVQLKEKFCKLFIDCLNISSVSRSLPAVCEGYTQKIAFQTRQVACGGMATFEKSNPGTLSVSELR